MLMTSRYSGMGTLNLNVIRTILRTKHIQKYSCCLITFKTRNGKNFSVDFQIVR